MVKPTKRHVSARVALYLRVSTRDGRQTTKNQLLQLRTFAKSSSWEIVKEYVDNESGTTSERSDFQSMLTDASRHRFDIVLFWALDRFSREGVFETLSHLRQLDSYGVRFRSYTEQYLDTCGMFKDAVIAIIAAIAQQESVRRSERITAGLARVKAEGKKLGQPPRDIDLELLASCREKGMSYSEMTQLFHCGRATLARRLKELKGAA